MHYNYYPKFCIIFIDIIFIMENSIILILLIVLVVIGWILYFFRNAIKDKYNKTSGKVKQTVSHAAKQVKEDIKD